MKHICEEVSWLRDDPWQMESHIMQAMQTKNMEFLSIYEDCWPIEELIKARLTYRKRHLKIKTSMKCASMVLRSHRP